MFIPLFLAVALLGQADDVAPEWDPTEPERDFIEAGDVNPKSKKFRLDEWWRNWPVSNEVNDPSEAPREDPATPGLKSGELDVSTDWENLRWLHTGIDIDSQSLPILAADEKPEPTFGAWVFMIMLIVAWAGTAFLIAYWLRRFLFRLLRIRL